MDIHNSINQLVQFREQVYSSFKHRRDSLMDLLDALCANEGASSVVELSLHERFRRGYSALYRAIEALGESVIPQDPERAIEDWEQQFSPILDISHCPGCARPQAPRLLAIWSRCDPSPTPSC